MGQCERQLPVILVQLPVFVTLRNSTPMDSRSRSRDAHDVEALPLLPSRLAGTEAAPPSSRAPARIIYGGIWAQIRTFSKIAIPFFYADRMALLMLLGLILLTVLSNGISVLFSFVKSWVFNALNEKDEASFWRYIEYFFAVLVVAVPISVSYTYLRLNLALRWRQVRP